MLLPDEQQESFIWQFTTEKPDADWMNPGFDATHWRSGPGGFGTHGTPGAMVYTEWNTPEIWLRREFRVPDPLPARITLIIHHDDQAKVWLNGVLVADLSGFTTRYTEIPVSAELRKAMVPGFNLLAIHCRQDQGGQFIDAGLRAETEDP